jgi:hypothetical protein
VVEKQDEMGEWLQKERGMLLKKAEIKKSRAVNPALQMLTIQFAA